MLHFEHVDCLDVLPRPGHLWSVPAVAFAIVVIEVMVGFVDDIGEPSFCLVLALMLAVWGAVRRVSYLANRER